MARFRSGDRTPPRFDDADVNRLGGRARHVWIIVDANEARTGLAEMLSASWDSVGVRRLSVGDIAIGDCVRVERKTAADLAASLADGRLFRQACRLDSSVSRPVVIQEGDPAELEQLVDRGAHRGALLSLSVGFRIPVIMTRDLEHTAVVLRHMAAQESKREARRRRRELAQRGPSRGGKQPKARLSPEAIEVLRAMPGVGPTRAEALGAYLPSLGDLARLGVRDLLAVPGIGPDTAARIVDMLRGNVG